MQEEQYPGNAIENDVIPEGGFKVPIAFPDPFILLCFFEKAVNDGDVTLHPWQMQVHKELTSKQFTDKHPCKYCLIAANGSGKDKFVIAPFAVWFVLCKIRSRVIITTASGTQLTNQTEPYITDLANKVNEYFSKNFGFEPFKIRQRYIKCLITGSEIRMFATDEKGRAEGYHPMEPNAEMAIVVNEGKTVSEEIHEALRRCTGYNYWLEVSSAGEPSGFFYRAATKWPNVKRITSYDCPHLSEEDIATDKEELGEHSAFFRSKHLSQFTTVNAETVISPDTIEYLLQYPPSFDIPKFPLRIGIDLAAGGDETAVCLTKGNKVVEEYQFRELDTTITADKLENYLIKKQISKNYEHIYADDGGVGRAIIDMLVRRGWNINRVMNQWAAVGNKKQYGNRGAENWYRVKRILEEKFLDVRNLSKKTREQLVTRHYKHSTNGGRIFLRSKKEEIAHGIASPDRADAFILSLTGLTVEDFIENAPSNYKSLKAPKERERTTFQKPEEVLEHYENKVTFANYEALLNSNTKRKCSRTGYRSLRYLLRDNN